MRDLHWTFTTGLVLAACAAQASYDFKDYTYSFSGGSWTYSNVSAEGTITGTSSAFTPAPGSWGMPLAITPNNLFTTGFQVHGLAGLGGKVRLDFSPGYLWGPGGEAILGNIHNGYEYRIEAWDHSGNPLDVNAWSVVAEYDSSAPGVSGYFSTSWTSRAAAGLSSLFYVADTAADPNMGQGGGVHLAGLQNNIGRIDLTLVRSDLIPNAQQVDFLFFYVGTVPEPGTMAALGAGLAALLARRRRR